MSVKKSIFYLTGHEITLRSEHLPLKKFLRKMTLNDMVNNWSTEIEIFNINFVYISGKDNVLADTLSRLIYMDPNLEQQPELKDHEFGKYCFEMLPKARGSAHNQVIGGEDFDVCEIQITYDNAEIWNFQLNCPWMTKNLFPYRSRTQKFGNYKIKFKQECIMNFISSKIMFC